MTPVVRSIASIILGFEFIVIFLGALVLYGLDAFADLGWPDWSALIIGGVVLVLTVAALALMRSRLGLRLGWLVQFILTAGVFVQPTLGIVGVMFGAIWWWGLRAGRRIDAQHNPDSSATPSN